ncbi:MAG: DsbA family protein [Arenicellales bacterium]
MNTNNDTTTGIGTTLYYAHDPMCSWCWGFAPTWEILKRALIKDYAGTLRVQQLLGGLAPDSDEPMPEDMQKYLQKTWATIQKRVPGTRFNFEFWERCAPRRSTWRACRAVIAARNQDLKFESVMIKAIQEAYYLYARNPSNFSTLAAIAEEIGVDRSRFSDELDAPETYEAHQNEIQQVRQLGIHGFPSLVLVRDSTAYGVLVDYSGTAKTLGHISRLMETASAA